VLVSHGLGGTHGGQRRSARLIDRMGVCLRGLCYVFSLYNCTSQKEFGGGLTQKKVEKR